MAAALATALAAAPADEAAAVRRDLAAVAGRSILFAHQSVGMNVLDGLRALSADAGAPLRIEQVDRVLPRGAVGHVYVGRNGDPEGKLAEFARLVDALEPDVALVKFCFADFSASTDAPALFAEYQRTLAALRARHPRTVFVHVTAPLTTVQGGAKAALKRALGRAPGGVAENARRAEYNALLRAAVAGREPLFDLARFESTLPDGESEQVAWNGAAVPALVAAYSPDGGHLDAAAARRAARELLAVLATAR